MSLYLFIRKSAYLILGALSVFFPTWRQNIFILCYHGVSNDGWDFSVKTTQFKRQIEHLLREYQIISTKELYNHLSGKRTINKPSVLLTFDDGYKDLLKVSGYLRSKNIKPILFYLPEPKKLKRPELGTKKAVLDMKEARQLLDMGWEIGSHSITHRVLTSLSDDDLKNELERSKRIIENKLKTTVKCFAYPKGKQDSRVARATKKAEYQMAFSVSDSLSGLGDDLFSVPRMGVDGTHSLFEFKVLNFIPIIWFRIIVRRFGYGI